MVNRYMKRIIAAEHKELKVNMTSKFFLENSVNHFLSVPGGEEPEVI